MAYKPFFEVLAHLPIGTETYHNVGLATDHLWKTTMDREENNIGNCPHCTRIIFKDAIFNSEASFSTRCPHCNKAVRVIIKHKVEIKLIAVTDERNPKKGPGSGIVVVILALYLPTIIHHVMSHADEVIDILT